MRTAVLSVIVAAVGLAGAGSAWGDEAPAAAPSAAAAAASKPAAATQSAAAPAAADVAAADAAEEKHLLSRGFTLSVRDGVRYFCHRETELGSRMEKKTCLTAAQSRTERQGAKDALGDIQRREINMTGH